MKDNFETSSTAKIFYVKKLVFRIQFESIHRTYSRKNIPMLVLNFVEPCSLIRTVVERKH